MTEPSPHDAFPHEALTSLTERTAPGGSPLASPQLRLPRPHVLRSACGLSSFVVVPMVRDGAVTALIYSAIDITEQ